MKRTIDIYSDLGEGTGLDAVLMPYLSSCNIACGGHAGDTSTMEHCTALAKIHGTMVGAHPGYPDRENFGRISPPTLNLQPLSETLKSQLAALSAICHRAQLPLSYVKPHGALYHDVARRPDLLEVLLQAMDEVCPGIPLMLQAQPQMPSLPRHTLWTEAFADRAYSLSGALVPRHQPGAVFTSAQAIFEQGRKLIQHQYVSTGQSYVFCPLCSLLLAPPPL